MSLYNKTFPYILKYKGISYRINRVAAGSGFNTTIEKETGIGTSVYSAPITFTADVDKTPAYIQFPIGTNGTIGDPSAQTNGTVLDDNLETVFVMQEGETEWGKQILQNMLHVMEQLDSVSSNLYNPLDDAAFWALK